MGNKLEYSFDDEVANRFCYDMDKNKIEIHYGGCVYDKGTTSSSVVPTSPLWKP